MDKVWIEDLAAEAAAVGVELDSSQLERLGRYADLLIKWNKAINLTSIDDPAGIRIKHLIDSLAAVKLIPADFAEEALDLGSGAGLPGIPWMVARPGLRVHMVDSVAKKVGFLKAAMAALAVTGKATQARLEGEPDREGLQPAALVTSRAFKPLGVLLPLLAFYLRPGGRLLLFAGPGEEASLERIAAQNQLSVEAEHRFELPRGAGARLLATLVPRGTSRLAAGTP